MFRFKKNLLAGKNKIYIFIFGLFSSRFSSFFFVFCGLVPIMWEGERGKLLLSSVALLFLWAMKKVNKRCDAQNNKKETNTRTHLSKERDVHMYSIQWQLFISYICRLCTLPHWTLISGRSRNSSGTQSARQMHEMIPFFDCFFQFFFRFCIIYLIFSISKKKKLNIFMRLFICPSTCLYVYVCICRVIFIIRNLKLMPILTAQNKVAYPLPSHLYSGIW